MALDGLRSCRGPGGLLLPWGRQTRESRCLRNYNGRWSAMNRWECMGRWIPHFCVSGAIVYDGCKLTRHRRSNKMAVQGTTTEKSWREGGGRGPIPGRRECKGKERGDDDS